MVPRQPWRPVKGGNELLCYVRDAQAQMFAGLQSLVARRPHTALNVLVERTVYCFEPFRCILDAVEFGGFSQCQQVTEPLGALDAPFEESCVAVDCHCSDASFYLVVIWTDVRIMQEAAQFISIVEPEDDSLDDRASFPSQIPAPVPLDSVLFRERHHDLIDALSINAVQCSRR